MIGSLAQPSLALDGRCGPDKSHKVDGVQLTQPAMSNKLT